MRNKEIAKEGQKIHRATVETNFCKPSISSLAYKAAKLGAATMLTIPRTKLTHSAVFTAAPYIPASSGPKIEPIIIVSLLLRIMKQPFVINMPF